jgi:hypothetical protein
MKRPSASEEAVRVVAPDGTAARAARSRGGVQGPYEAAADDPTASAYDTAWRAAVRTGRVPIWASRPSGGRRLPPRADPDRH